MLESMMTINVAPVKPPEAAPSSLIRDRIVCFVNDDLSADALLKGLEGCNIEIKRGTIRNAIHMLETDTELLALVADISEVDDPFAQLEGLSRVCPADVRVALIGDNKEIAFYRALMDLGLSEYLPKPLTRNIVQTQLRRRLIDEAAPGPIDRGGQVVSICGAQGGAGATSIAIGLAMLLAETTKAKVALLDLNLQGGESSVMLGVRPGQGLRIALENPARADSLFIERAAIEINDRVRLFAADEELDATFAITKEGVSHVLGLLRQRFNYIVVDLPIPLSPAIYPVIAASRHAIVLLEAEVTGLRNAKALRAALARIAGENRVLTLLNRADRAGGLPIESIVKGLGGKPDLVIPDLGKGMTEAINLGIPALNHVPRLRRHLAPIVREIAALEDESKGWLRRILGR
ncbi:AAA family ATPase [uncultured Rhodoblastus sp.]|uniref:AAA family ATPase n=1 Tax=uncultured Rhodoblastus sp. TaxID=543037 RepID=UPI0025F7091B|nr:AAA family ATPase [uncultured Rhodoblastus sp.]